MDLELNVSKFAPTTAAEQIVLAEFEDENNTIIAYGSEDLIITPAQRAGKTFEEVLELYGHTIGMTFNASKMTLRKESVEDENEDAMVSFNRPAEAGVYILNSGSDSKGLL